MFSASMIMFSKVQAADEQKTIKVDKPQEYTFLDTVTPEFVIFKQSNNYIAIWTPEEDHESVDYYYQKALEVTGSGSLKGFKSKVEFFYGENATTLNNGKNIGTYQVIERDNGWYAYSSGGKISIVIFREGKQEFGSLKVAANVIKEHEKTIYQPIWQKKVQPVWQREVTPVWQREYQPMWQREVQPYLVPTFEKKVSSVSGTLVSWLENGTKAGGKFNNNMTWLELDLAEARRAGGIWYTIADSSPNNNPIQYQYNVRVEGNELILSLDERLISANVTAKLYSSVPLKHDTSGHVALEKGNEYRVQLPETTQEVMYMFVHFDGVTWYTTGRYEFAGWQQDDAKTEVVTDKWIRDDLVSEEHLRDEINEYWVRDDVLEDYFVRNDFVRKEMIEDEYNVLFNLVVKNSDGKVVYSGTVANNKDVTIPKLIPGEYTCIISGEDIGTVTKTVNVVAHEEAQIDFNDIPNVQGEPEEEYLEKEYLEDIVEERRYLEDIIKPIIYENKYLEKKYLEDILLPAIKLGDEINPDGEYAVKLN